MYLTGFQSGGKDNAFFETDFQKVKYRYNP